ncbi:hypothetical protein BDV93DRAFT_565733 [Ceratobasidium sp. AG-I]|nr:hypothetical protein BDV93DRAFT_565733 [Ceratobasidium sp. AG-I]
MPRPGSVFDYPIKRPYPWRFTTSLISVTSTFILTGLVYINLAIVGQTPTTFSSTTFGKPPDDSWIDRVNYRKVLNTRDCDPTTLVSGGTYRTQNGMFPYTIESITSAESGEKISTLVYEGQVIENCTDTALAVAGDFYEQGLTIVGNVTCTFSGGIQLIAGFNTDTNSGGLAYEPHNHTTQVASQLVKMLSDEAVSQLSGFHPCPFRFAVNTSHTTPSRERCEDETLTASTLDVLLNIGANYAQMLWSTIYLDLGINSPYYIMDNSELMRQLLQSNVDAITKLNTSQLNQGHVSQDVLANMTGYGLPLEAPKQVQVLAQYLCNGMAWKKPSTLVIDVAVATISLFMAYWGALNFVLRFIATRSSPHGNFCVCPNCNELPQLGSTTFENHELRSLDSGILYKSVPTRSQSTPP